MARGRKNQPMPEPIVLTKEQKLAVELHLAEHQQQRYEDDVRGRMLDIANAMERAAKEVREYMNREDGKESPEKFANHVEWAYNKVQWTAPNFGIDALMRDLAKYREAVGKAEVLREVLELGKETENA